MALLGRHERRSAWAKRNNTQRSVILASIIRAIANFAVAYVDQTERSYQALVAAKQSGRIIAEKGILGRVKQERHPHDRPRYDRQGVG
jgi:hypothetical protein